MSCLEAAVPGLMSPMLGLEALLVTSVLVSAVLAPRSGRRRLVMSATVSLPG